MNFGPRQYAGLALTIIGFLMVGGIFTPLAEVNYDPTPPVVNPIMPSGSIAAPTPVRQGDRIAISAYVSDPETGVLNGHVSVYSGDFVELLGDWQLGTQGGSVYRSYQDYTIPAGEGRLYAVQFYATNNMMLQTIATAYMKTTSAPSGQFYINNIAVNQDSVINVTSPNLALKFQATKEGGEIVRCFVDVKKDGILIATVDLSETTADTTWSGSYTLGAPGTYILTGVITNGFTGYTLMSITVGLPGSSGFEITMNTIVGAVALLFGLYLMLGKKAIPT